MPPRMKDKYDSEVAPALREQFQYGNVMQIPKLTKVVVNIGMGEALTDANDLVEMMMHFIGKGLGPMREIDREVGDLSEDAINNQKAFSYLRYNVTMEPETFARLKLDGIEKQNIDDLMNMDAAKNVEELIRIGEAAGRNEVKEEHFPATFDVAPTAETRKTAHVNS